jgi:hypothetical protein
VAVAMAGCGFDIVATSTSQVRETWPIDPTFTHLSHGWSISETGIIIREGQKSQHPTAIVTRRVLRRQKRHLFPSPIANARA